MKAPDLISSFAAMQAIIMAAGRGTRLGSLTEDKPKALVEVSHKPLIEHALCFAKQTGATHRVVVGGYGYTQLAKQVQKVDPQAHVVENTELRCGNVLSLIVGHSALTPDGGFLLMNSDHIYSQEIANIVAKTAQETTRIVAFCDFDRELGPDDMKVKLQDHVVRDISKKLPSWDAGYVGMTYVPQNCRAEYDRALEQTLHSVGDNSCAEDVLVLLAKDAEPPVIADISGHGWFEIDNQKDRNQAEAVLNHL
ncbi:MAG: NTP transferase domain-containing protein [Pseudomonadota bacterium]